MLATGESKLISINMAPGFNLVEYEEYSVEASTLSPGITVLAKPKEWKASKEPSYEINPNSYRVDGKKIEVEGKKKVVPTLYARYNEKTVRFTAMTTTTGKLS